MTWWEAVLIVLAGVGASTMNTIVGSGTLITFPTLLMLGVPPVTANMSNTVGLVAGGITGIAGYRRELVGSRRDLLRLAPMTLVGSVIGALLLLVLDPAAFRAIVPVLILLGVVLVLAGPRISAAVASHHPDDQPTWKMRLMQVGVLLAGIYGGYFGAAQGVLLMGIMSLLSPLPIQRLNGYKNVLGTVANAVAAIVFIVVAGDRIDWRVAALIAVGALIGGAIGSTVGRRLSPGLLRAIIAVIGLVAVVKVLLG